MREKHYLKCIVIVHGRSEKQMCDYIKSNLRIQMDIVGDKKGGKSIQITSLGYTLNNTIFGKYDNFIKKYDNINWVKDGKKKKIDPEFKIFIIVDTDDCTEKQKKDFISKEMFRKHWAYDYIVPIYNSPELESVLTKANIPFEKKGTERKKEYIKIFPTSPKYEKRETIELQDFCDNLRKVNSTNMNKFVEFCLNCS